MSLYVCDICEAIENTALGGPHGYHLRNVPLPEITLDIDPAFAELGDGKARCSECNPEVGKWHGHFPKEEFDPERDTNRVVNRGDPL